MRRLAGRLFLVLFGLCLAAVLLEAALRVAPRFAPALRGGRRAAFTILCVGDSHTYGLHVPWPQSYPALLQARLDPAAERIGVLNYGVPGRNAARLLQVLPDYLDETDPDLVLILVGFNDTWNADGTEGEPRPPPAWATLRIVRLVRMLRLVASGTRLGPPDVVERGEETLVVEHGEERPGARPAAGLEPLLGRRLHDALLPRLTALVETVRRFGSRPVLLTYAPDQPEPFPILNATIAEAAAATGTELVALHAAFSSASPRAAPLLFPDHHPTARGNALMADEISRALRERSLVPPVAASAPRPLEGRVGLRIEVGDHPGTLRAEVFGPPRRPFQIVLSTRRSPPLSLFGLDLPIAESPAVARSLESLSLRGNTDEAGRAEVEFEPARFLAAPQAGRPWVEAYAVAVVFPIVPSPETPPLFSPAAALPAPP